MRRFWLGALLALITAVGVGARWIHVAHGRPDGFWIVMISVFVLGALLMNRVVDFIMASGRKSDRIFLILFFVLLFLPMTNISQAKKSERENRTLAKPAELFVKHTLNNKYGVQFDKWFNDRFFLRHDLLNVDTFVHRISRYMVNSKAVWDRKTNWMCVRNDKRSQMTIEEAKAVLEALESFNKYVKSIGADLYFLVAPELVDIYGTEIPDYCKSLDGKINKDAIAYIQEHASFPVIHPYQEMIEASDNDYVFFKTEHHWTEYGAFIGYKKLMEEIKKRHRNLKVMTEDDYDIMYNKLVRGEWGHYFSNGHTANYVLNVDRLAHKYLGAEYRYYEPKNELEPIKTGTKERSTKFYVNPMRKDRSKAVQLGNSFSECLQQFIPYSFHELHYYRLNRLSDGSNPDNYKVLKLYGDEITAYKPDVIIISISSNVLHRLKDLVKD